MAALTGSGCQPGWQAQAGPLADAGVFAAGHGGSLAAPKQEPARQAAGSPSQPTCASSMTSSRYGCGSCASAGRHRDCVSNWQAPSHYGACSIRRRAMATFVRAVSRVRPRSAAASSGSCTGAGARLRLAGTRVQQDVGMLFRTCFSHCRSRSPDSARTHPPTKTTTPSSRTAPLGPPIRQRLAESTSKRGICRMPGC